MPWRVGLDEAGYGPNLGPLVLSSSACHVPADAPPCLWGCLAAAVRKAEHPNDGRLLIDDSKKVNQGDAGLAKLEAGVLAAVGLNLSPPTPPPRSGEGGLSVPPPSPLRGGGVGGGEVFAPPATVIDYLSAVALGDSVDDLAAEPWFQPDDLLPAAHPADELPAVAAALSEACGPAGIGWGPVRSVVIPAPKFNRLLDEWKLKSGVLASGVIALLQATLELPGDEPIHITVDKLGGRHFYAPLLNEAFPGGWVRVIREGPERCEYAIDHLSREVSLRFEPRADGGHLNVALASMAAKYLREVCMLQFNRYWTAKVPGLKPTAGYPTDAGRFFKGIKRRLKADGIAERLVWRAK